MQKTIPFLLLSLCLTGCIGYGNGIMSYAINGSSSTERTFTEAELNRIEIFFGINTKPSQPFKQLSYLEATGDEDATIDDLVLLLKKEAAKYGADAIIEITRMAEAREAGTIAFTEGNHVYDAMVLTGIAVKYTEEAKKIGGS